LDDAASKRLRLVPAKNGMPEPSITGHAVEKTRKKTAIFKRQQNISGLRK
jgi:hypothetical protein